MIALPTTSCTHIYWRPVRLHAHRVACAQCAQLSVESLCFLVDLAVVLINPIEVVASSPSPRSTSLVADPPACKWCRSTGIPTVHHIDQLTSLALQLVTLCHFSEGGVGCWAVYISFFIGKPRKLMWRIVRPVVNNLWNNMSCEDRSQAMHGIICS